MAMDKYLDEKERRAVVRRTTAPHTTKEQPTMESDPAPQWGHHAMEEQPTMEIDDKAWERKMDSTDGTENGLDRGQLLLHTHELETRCLELRRQIATLRGHQGAGVREAVGDEMIYLAGIRRRLGT